MIILLLTQPKLMRLRKLVLIVSKMMLYKLKNFSNTAEVSQFRSPTGKSFTFCVVNSSIVTENINSFVKMAFTFLDKIQIILVKNK